jgi:hypothetical protein
MEPFINGRSANYHGLQYVENKSWICGYCSRTVSSDRGYKIGNHQDASGVQVGGIYICPNCRGPAFFPPTGGVYPSPAFGTPVLHLPENVEAVYEEARRSVGVACYTGAVLLCRKLLMNIAVAQGAQEGLRFIEYVDFLAANGYIPPNGRHWVDHIRRKGNEATHEIIVMTETDAKEILIFTEMLLKFVYEFPAIVPAPNGTP